MKTCPICSQEDKCRALSRHDNTTLICSQCANIEALAPFAVSTGDAEYLREATNMARAGWIEFGPIHETKAVVEWKIHRMYMLLCRAFTEDYRKTIDEGFEGLASEIAEAGASD